MSDRGQAEPYEGVPPKGDKRWNKIKPSRRSLLKKLLGVAGIAATAATTVPFLMNEDKTDKDKQQQEYLTKIEELDLGTIDGALKKINLGIKYNIYKDRNKVTYFRGTITGMGEVIRTPYEDNSNEMRKKFEKLYTDIKTNINTLNDDEAKTDLSRLLELYYYKIIHS